MTANSQRLRELADAIELKATTTERPLAKPIPDFKMDRWATSGLARVTVFDDINICDTAGCIAGSTVALFDPDKYKKFFSVYPRHVSMNAGLLLSLDTNQECALFTPTVHLDCVTAAQAVRVLRWFADNPDANYDQIIHFWNFSMGRTAE